ncbi:hypothetical protein TNCV_1533181 [Trichonephila clavipes]|nr:hypothetical protein TNCV_1533181 [Trichonephila clavipes]
MHGGSVNNRMLNVIESVAGDVNRVVENCVWLFISGERLVGPQYASTTKWGDILTTLWSLNGKNHIGIWEGGFSCHVTADRRAPNSSKNWEWTTESDINASGQTLSPYGDELLYSFLQEVCSPLVYCYRCINIGSLNSSTSTARWTESKNSFIQDPPQGKPSTASSAIGSGSMCSRLCDGWSD